jgi:DNA-binding MarR family transcriptional regulator
VPQATKERAAAPEGSAEVAIDQIDAALQVVSRSITQARLHERLLRRAGVRLDRAGSALLYRLHLQRGPLRVTSLADLLGVDAPTVTRKVQQLEYEGYVVRDADPDDGRATLIRLSPSGRRTLQRVLDARRSWLGELFAPWDDEELTAFASLLRRFSATLEGEAGEEFAAMGAPKKELSLNRKVDRN